MSQSSSFIRSSVRFSFVALSCALVACGAHKDSSTSSDDWNDWGYDGALWDTGSFEIGGGFGPPAPWAPHVTDGTFTEGEWSYQMKLVGKYAHMYIDVQVIGDKPILFFLNDWHKNQEGPVHASCFNRFDFFNPDTNDAVVVKVYGDHHITVFWNGADVTKQAKGKAGFGPSPNLATPHSIFEFQMEALHPGKWLTALCDPPAPQPPVGTVTESACEDPAFLLEEPKVVKVGIGTGAVATFDPAPVVPLAYALDNYRAAPDAKVTALGRNFGDIPGDVSLLTESGTTVKAPLIDWSPTRITFTIPTGIKGRVISRFDAGTAKIDGPALCVCPEAVCDCIARSKDPSGSGLPK